MSTENIERKENLNQEVKETVPDEKLWVKKEGLSFSVMELQDFGKFLIGTKEHREGKMICLQIRLEDPLEVRFFSDDPNKADDIYNVTADYKNKSLKIVTTQETFERIDALLKEFGFVPKK